MAPCIWPLQAVGKARPHEAALLATLMTIVVVALRAGFFGTRGSCERSGSGWSAGGRVGVIPPMRSPALFRRETAFMLGAG